jgi:hypothetical protein
MRNVGICLIAALAVAVWIAPAPAATRVTPYLWQNCTHVHTKYRHGVGKRYAHDHTRSGTNSVTNFFRSTRLYRIAMRWNSDLDRDRDGIACEKR